MMSSSAEVDDKFWSIRLLPLTIFSVLLGASPFILNPGLFWDDWVWKYTDPAEHIRIGRQLGVWWAGYLSQVINGSEHTALISRLIAFVGWLAAAAGFSVTLRARGALLSREAFFAFLAICACHVGVIRFVESMAMANAYIGSFWVGCAILACKGQRPGWRIASMVFFLFSFHLNSMLFMYVLVLGVMFLDMLPSSKTAARPVSGDARSATLSAATTSLSGSLHFLRRAPRLAIEFLRKNLGFVSLPFVFVLLIKIPSLILALFFSDAARVYSNYNTFNPLTVFSAIPGSVRLAEELTLQYLGTLSSIRPLFFLGLFVFNCALLALLPRSIARPNPRKTLVLIGVGAVLVVAGIYPYVLVDKPPRLSDFYESRHILVAVPGIVLAWLSIAAMIPALAPASFLRLGKLVQTFLVACLLSGSTCSLLLQGFDLFKDWMQQEATSDFLRRNQRDLTQFKTFVFDDVGGYRFSNRYVWNYEYTGGLIAVFGGKERFGLSIQEYSSLPPNVPLLRFKEFRARYNIKDYDFSAPHLYIRIDDKPWRLRIFDVLTVAWRYWITNNYNEKIAEAFSFQTSNEFIEADQRIAEMRPVVSALIKAKRSDGYYPSFKMDSNDVSPSLVLGEGRIYSEVNGVRQLGFVFPDRSMSPNCFDRNLSTYRVETCSSNPYFLYLSDGVDFKLIYRNAKDLPYARQAYGSMVDEKNKGYGIWTNAASSW